MNRLHLYIIALLLSSCSSRNKEITFVSGEKTIASIITNKKSISVGDSALVKISVEKYGEYPVVLVIDNGISPIVKSVPNKKVTVLKLSGNSTLHAGFYSLYLLQGDNIISQTELSVIPGKAYKDIKVYTGPKTITANNQDQSMIVAVSEDQWNNTIIDGSPITITSRIENSQALTEQILVKNQIAHKIINAQENKNFKLLGISSSDVVSKQQRIDFVPDWMKSLQINLIEHYPVANNRHFVKIKTNTVTDKNKNIIPDGTFINFFLTDKNDKQSIYQSLIIDGIATCYVKNPKSANSYNIYAISSNGVKSNTLSLTFTEDLRAIKYKWDKNKLVIGPLIGQLGESISDGTEVVITDGTKMLIKESLRGYTTFDLTSSNLDISKLEIKISGLTREVRRNE